MVSQDNEINFFSYRRDDLFNDLIESPVIFQEFQMVATFSVCEIMPEKMVKTVSTGKGGDKKIPIFSFEKVEDCFSPFIKGVEKILKKLLFLFSCFPVVYVYSVIHIFKFWVNSRGINTFF